MTVHTCEQRSAEWYDLRQSLVITASEMGEFCVPDIAVTVEKLKADLAGLGIAIPSKAKREDLLKLVPDTSVYFGYTEEQKKARRSHINRKIAPTAYPAPIGELSSDARREWDQWEREAVPADFWLRRHAESKERALAYDAAVQLGNVREAEARAAFEKFSGLALHQVGLCIHARGFMGCSPDALVKDGEGNWIEGYESKCPLPETHLAYLDDPGALLKDYKAQVHGSMVVTGLARWNLWSWCPPYPPVHLVVERDEYTGRMETGLVELNREFTEKWNRVVEATEKACI